MQRLFPIEIGLILPMHVRHTITCLCFFFQFVMKKSICIDELDVLPKELVKTIFPIEKFFLLIFLYYYTSNSSLGSGNEIVWSYILVFDFDVF